jgi:Cu+-exporting ATPase
MVGDGINDAPSLTIADIGVGLNSGTDIAGNSADVILMKDNLNGIYNLIDISKKTLRNIKQNLFWAFFYNICMIPIAIGLLKFINIEMNPMIAGLAMTISSLTVVFNALRLKRWKEK